MKKLNFNNIELENKILNIAKSNGYIPDQKSETSFITNKLSKPAFNCKLVTNNNYLDALDIINVYQKDHSAITTNYGIIPGLKATLKECNELLNSLTKDLNPQCAYEFTGGIINCPLINLDYLYKSKIAPKFFSLHPDGCIIVVATSIEYIRRASFTRLLYNLKNYPNLEIYGKSGFKTLQYWNLTDPQILLKKIIDFLLHSYTPYILGFSADHSNYLKFIFIPDYSPQLSLEESKMDWLYFLKYRSDFTVGQIDLNVSPNSIGIPLDALYNKYVFVNPPSIIEKIKFMIWGIEQANKLASKLYDITNFVDSCDEIDPIYAFEYALTIMHILSDATFILYSNSSYQNKSVTFRIADMISQIASLSTLNDYRKTDFESQFFKKLFRCDEGKSLIFKILSEVDNRIIKEYSIVSENIYNNLKKLIIESVWLNEKKTGVGISVKDKMLKNEITEDYDSFTGNVIRSFRNLHHGYFTKSDSRQRPSRYLSLIDGNMPNEFPTLAILWILALLESPEKLIGNP